MSKINSSRFYKEWKGHPISDLSSFYNAIIRHRGEKPIVYLVGDSSLDNKFWVPSGTPLLNGSRVAVPDIYNAALDSPNIKPDVAFWLNHVLGDKATALNLAVEESLLRERDTELLPHDSFVRDHLRSDDILIVSVGGNDIAMLPTLSTAFHMLRLSWLSSTSSLEHGTAWAYPHFVHLFKDKIAAYIEKLISVQKPRAVMVCMIYFPLQANVVGSQRSWADTPLKLLGYNREPKRLQTTIKQVYEKATKNIDVAGTKLLPFALFEVLDGKSAIDYTARVEPSAEGGRKMAEQLAAVIEEVMRDG
jgi:hypothetical protein